MRIVRQDVRSKAFRRHAGVEKWLRAWVVTASDATWMSLKDVRDDYPSADGVTLKSRVVVTVFNVKGNEYRLLTSINYQQQFIVLLDVLTHSGYSKNLWKDRY